MIDTFYNLEAEKVVLGSILIEPEEVLDKLDLKHSDYHKSAHRYIVKAIQALQAVNKPVELTSIAAWLEANNLLDNVGGVMYLSKLAGSVPTTENVKFYESLIKKQARKRKIQKTLQRMQDKLFEVDEDDEIDILVNQGIETLSNTGDQKENGFTHISNVMVDVVNHAAEERGDVIGVPSGYAELDRMLGGFKPGELHVVGARPSMGKSAFMLNIATKAGQYGALVPLYSLEMLNRSLGQRILSSEAQINSRNLKIGSSALNDENWRRITAEVGMLSQTDILLNDTSGIYIHDIRRDLKQLRKDNPDREILCFIDYLQLIQGDQKHRSNRTQEISEISRTLKMIAQDLKLTIVALSQLSRGVEQRQDKRPMMSDIRESGSIEQDADVVMFLYRDDYYDKESENKNIIEVIIAKQREGATGTVSLAFVKDYGRFVSLERRFDSHDERG